MNIYDDVCDENCAECKDRFECRDSEYYTDYDVADSVMMITRCVKCGKECVNCIGRVDFGYETEGFVEVKINDGDLDSGDVRAIYDSINHNIKRAQKVLADVIFNSCIRPDITLTVDEMDEVFTKDGIECRLGRNENGDNIRYSLIMWTKEYPDFPARIYLAEMPKTVDIWTVEFSLYVIIQKMRELRMSRM